MCVVVSISVLVSNVVVVSMFVAVFFLDVTLARVWKVFVFDVCFVFGGFPCLFFLVVASCSFCFVSFLFMFVLLRSQEFAACR